MISYQEYLNETNKNDTRQAWIDWKMERCDMPEEEAIKAAYDEEWGYSQIQA
ncbi:hypothetical protein [Christensenella intestinihominis]|uniref:hypothetical protein n=1 Tax=Christensenella intestinihominis TaxID=1851429 RepID=UPI0012EAFDCB|nr:hypothetical protein [Christensenella intestinihominis]